MEAGAQSAMRQPVPIGYRHLILAKISYSLMSSIAWQLSALLLFLLIVTIDILHPVDWLLTVLAAFRSVKTWLFLALFLGVIFAQCILCAKDFIFKSTYSSTRIRKLISVFSLQNIALLLLHVLSSVLGNWLLLSQTSGAHSSLYVPCAMHGSCVSEGTFYILAGGIWFGCYYFVRIYNNTERIVFPVIYQRKVQRFKVTLIPLIRRSYRIAIAPTLYFTIAYFTCDLLARKKFAAMLGVLVSDGGLMTHAYLYLYGGLFIFNMNLMRFFFELYLTEPLEFPLTMSDGDNENTTTLAASLNVDNIPIIQHLASADLYSASRNATRRQILFVLSQPGGHPHNWNYLLRNVSMLVQRFVNTINESSKSATKKVHTPSPTLPRANTVISPLITSPQNARFSRIRNMTMIDPVSPTLPPQSQLIDVQVKQSDAITEFSQKFHDTIERIKECTGINYMFGELPEASVQRCLSDGQMIIWAIQGLTTITTASLMEDRYGIVQKDLVAIITMLVELKLTMDQLNRLPALACRGPKQFDVHHRMKISIHNAVKRCLYSICTSFRQYIKDMPLKPETLSVIQGFTFAIK